LSDIRFAGLPFSVATPLSDGLKKHDERLINSYSSRIKPSAMTSTLVNELVGPIILLTGADWRAR
jgi:hypothetical protein